MNTKTITDKVERKKIKRTVRKKAAPKAKRAAGVARGSHQIPESIWMRPDRSIEVLEQLVLEHGVHLKRHRVAARGELHPQRCGGGE